MAARGRIDFDAVSIELGGERGRFLAVQAFTARIEPAEIVCILGPSGCGKSTLLGALAGHLAISSGRLRVDGEAVTGPAPGRGLVFQHHTLFPWFDTVDNIGYGLKMRGVRRAERHRQARAVMATIGLEGFEHHYPSQLSGGMQQRAEIARVLINDPEVLLMDEPFSALDALTRLRMQDLLLALWAERRPTIVFVTHDIDEALVLADRILVMSARPGRLIEEIAVDQARPRGDGWLTTPRFADIKRHCLGLLRHGHFDDDSSEATGLCPSSPLASASASAGAGAGASPRDRAGAAS